MARKGMAFEMKRAARINLSGQVLLEFAVMLHPTFILPETRYRRALVLNFALLAFGGNGAIVKRSSHYTVRQKKEMSYGYWRVGGIGYSSIDL